MPKAPKRSDHSLTERRPRRLRIVYGTSMSPEAAARVCALCHLPIEEGGGQRVGVSWVHRELVHCDQLVEVSDVASFLDQLVEKYDALECAISYTRRDTITGSDRYWKLVVVTRTQAHKSFEQGMHETVPSFFLRVSGGLVELS